MKRILNLIVSATLTSTAMYAHANPADPTSHAPRAPEVGTPENIKRAQEVPPPAAPPGQILTPREAAGSDSLEQRAGVTQLVWGTELGRMYSEYLFGTSTPEENLRNVHRIVDRLFASPFLSMNRVSGIQLMTEDVYNTGRVDPVVNDRIGLLLLNISLKRHALEVEAARQINWQLPALALFGFFSGSKLVRVQAGTFAKYARTNLRWLLLRRGRDEALASRAAVRALKYKDLLSWGKLRENYSAGKAFAGAAGALFFYTPWYFQAMSGTSESATPVQKVLIYGLEQWIDLRNL